VDPYAQIPRFYDAEFGHLETDVSFFARVAVGGPLLVLGAGTGRVCRPYEPIRPVTGLDRSEPMLAIARSTPGPGGPWGPTRYVAGELERFDVGRVAEIIAPNGAFSFLPTRAAQQACLESCARALPPGAPLVLDLPMPDFRWLGQAHTPEKMAWEGEIDGQAAKRTREVRRWPIGQRLELHDRFYVAGDLVAESTLPLRIVYPAEIEWIVEASGFYVDATFGDYALGPVKEGCPRLIVRALRL
jgi:SAM-dependent methyltransferase